MPVLMESAPLKVIQTGPILYRLTVSQYHRMIDTGILKEGDPVELLEGHLVQKMTKYPPHAVSLELLNEHVRPLLPVEWCAREQNPITLSDSEPEPDFTVVCGKTRHYAERHPGPADIGLVIEVSDSSLEYDRTTKGRIYARARIPFYWIVNLIEGQVEVYSQPKAGKSPAYRQRQDYSADTQLPLIIAGQEIAILAVRDLLPDVST